MKVVSTFHAPSTAVSSLRLQTPDSLCLVLARTDVIEVYKVTSDGLYLLQKLDIWGRILSVKPIPNQSSAFLVLTDHPDPRLIFMTLNGTEIISTGVVSLFEPSARVAEFFADVVVNPYGTLAVVSSYTSKLRFVKIEGGRPQANYDVSTMERNILSLAFISSLNAGEALAILHIDSSQNLVLLSRDINETDMDLSPTASVILPQTILSDSHFPVPDCNLSLASVNWDGNTLGTLVLGGRKIMYYETADLDTQDRHRRKQERLRKKSEDTSGKKGDDKAKAIKERKATAKVDWPWADVSSWCDLGDHSRFLIADAYGRLAILSLIDLHLKEKDMGYLLIHPLGETTTATTITHLDGPYVFLGSHYGPSQIIRIHGAPVTDTDLSTLPIPPPILTTTMRELIENSDGSGKGKDKKSDLRSGRVLDTRGHFVEVVDTLQNVAPIMDALVMENKEDGQSDIITCSGGRNAGSINVIRVGADFQELMSIEGIENITQVWQLKTPSIERARERHILVSTLYKTIFLSIDTYSSEVKQVSTPHATFDTGSPSLAAGTMSALGALAFVQVTRRGVVVVEYDEILENYSRKQVWTTKELNEPKHTDKEIVTASITSSHLLLGLAGGILVLLSIGYDGLKLATVHEIWPELKRRSEIATVICHTDAAHLVVAFWQTNDVRVYKTVDNLGKKQIQHVCSTPSLGSLPRALLLHKEDLRGRPYKTRLVVGLSDGTVETFLLENERNLKERVSLKLGDLPVALHQCEIKDRHTVLAVGSRALLIYWGKTRIKKSPVNVKHITAACDLDIAQWGKCLVLVSPLGLKIGRISNLEKLHIHSKLLGHDVPRTIRYHPKLDLFGIACEREYPGRVGDIVRRTSTFRIVKPNSFDELAQLAFDDESDITAIESFVFNGDQGQVNLFCIGISSYEETKPDEATGSIHLVIVQPAGDGFALSNAYTHKVPGTIYSIVNSNGYVAIAVGSAVHMYKLAFEDGAFTLTGETKWNHSYTVSNLVAKDNMLFLGDQISSVSVLKNNSGKFANIAKDFSPLWPVAIQATAEGGIIGANANGNLFIYNLRNNPRGQMVLENVGSYHLNDHVTKIIPGSIGTIDLTDDEHLRPEHIFFTVSGRIGVILDMSDELSKLMSELQRNMGGVLIGVGDIAHARYRAPVEAKRRSDAYKTSEGFLDGDFLERFSRLGEADLQKVLQGQTTAETLATPKDVINKILERMQSLH